jgi:hypothetical protein
LDGSRVFITFVPIEIVQSGSSTRDDDLNKLESATLDLARTITLTSSSDASGSTTSPARESSIATNWTNSVAATQPVDSESASEGGLVEIAIAVGASPRSFGPAESAPALAPWKSTDRDSAKSPGIDSGNDDGDSRLLGDSRPQSGGGFAEIVEAEDAAQGSRHALDSREGGGIELAVAMLSTVQPGDGSRTPGTAAEDPSKGSKEIRMESGVGLFEAFELATSDSQDDSVSGSPTDDTQGAVSSVTNDPQSVADGHVSQGAALRGNQQNEPPMEGPGAVSTLMAAILVVATDGLGLGTALSERDGDGPSTGRPLRTPTRR